MIEKTKRTVFQICGFLSGMILVMFTLSVDNAYADSVYQYANSEVTGQEEVFPAANQEQRPEQQTENKDDKPEEMKNKSSVHSMMGFGDAGKNWMWTCMIIVLMVIMMV